MPLLTDSTGAAIAAGRTVRIPGLPDFNAGDDTYKVTAIEGWFDGVTPEPVLVANGGAAGAVAVGDWDPVEAYYTIVGRVSVDRESKALMRRLLISAFPADRESSLVVLGGDLDEDLQVFVRGYDRPAFPPGDAPLNFTLPLVAPDPFKYALAPLAGEMGVFTGQTWFREYDPTSRHYALDGSWVRHYEQAVPSGPYPPSVTLSSNGDATSRRVVVTVTGPVTVGEWWLLNETTGEQLWVDVSLTAEQQLVLDSRTRTARLNGSPVDHLVFGDFPTLAPGDNLFRLVSGTQSDAYASVEAFEAYL